MNRVKTLLAASIALALAFTISCSDDKEEDKSDSYKYCEVSTTGSPINCLELSGDECSPYSYAAPYNKYNYKKVEKCAEEPLILCFRGKNEFINCNIEYKSDCEENGYTPFKTIKECLNYNPS